MQHRGYYFDDAVITEADLIDIIINSYDRFCVTDANGILVFMSESFSSNPDQLLGQNVDDLVISGLYDKSTIRECIRLRKEVTDIIREPGNIYSISTSRPIFDESGELKFVVTNNRSDAIVQQLNREIEREKLRGNQYQELSQYITNYNLRGQDMVANSLAMQRVLQTCDMFANTDAPVLIGGESGTGKEVLANYIYKRSDRKDRSYICINCAAIHKDLVESELFGYEKGAFTGAKTEGNRGVFEMANNGTLFLDEIGELPLNIQPKLLRVLENGEIRRVGSSKVIKVNVRIIAATNRDLKKMVENGQFREDLYYRLNVLQIQLPPLRERKDDIIPLTSLFLQKLNQHYNTNKHLTEDTVTFLEEFDWPGNVRELKNLLERLFIISNGSKIHYVGDYAAETNKPSLVAGDSKEEIRNLKEEVEKFKLEYIFRAIEQCNGKISEAAEKLGVHRSLLYKIMKENS